MGLSVEELELLISPPSKRQPLSATFFSHPAAFKASVQAVQFGGLTSWVTVEACD